MCFGSTQQSDSNTAAASGSNDYDAAINAVDGEYVKAVENKKGKRTADAFDVLGSLIRAQRDGNTSRIKALVDEYVQSLR